MNKDTVFASERLLFKEFKPGDGPLIYELNSDPEVIKYLHEPFNTPEKADEVITDIILPQYKLYNHGRWAVYLQNTDVFIGWCGLKFRPERKKVDLGYRLMKKYWGNGYATEAAKRTIQYGFTVLQLPRLFAAAHVQNLASQKVLEKVGFQYLGDEIIDDCMARTYEIILKDFLNS